MKCFILVSLVFCSLSLTSQNKKTLQDSIFVLGDTLKLPELLFSFNGGYISDPSFVDSVKVVAQFLKEHVSLKVEIINYTDSRGSSEANLILSRRRAESIVDYLIYLGIDEKRLSSKGHRESRLIYSNDNILYEEDYELKEEMHRVNRRTEIIIIGLN